MVTVFVDRPVNRLLDLDDQREMALPLLKVGLNLGEAIPPPPEAVIVRRGSSHRFRRAPITYRHLSTILD